MTLRSFDWFYRGVSTAHDPELQHNGGYSFWPIRQAGDPPIAKLALDLTSKWLAGLYILARTSTGLAQPAELYFKTAWQIV